MALIPKIDTWESIKETFEWAWVSIKLFAITLGWKGFSVLALLILVAIIFGKMKTFLRGRLGN